MKPARIQIRPTDAFAVAILLGFAARGVPSSLAMEWQSRMQAASPVILARHFESLTEGGPFNPAYANSIARTEQANDASSSPTSAGHDLW